MVCRIINIAKLIQSQNKWCTQKYNCFQSVKVRVWDIIKTGLFVSVGLEYWVPVIPYWCNIYAIVFCRLLTKTMYKNATGKLMAT
jgi:hypothetical protein